MITQILGIKISLFCWKFISIPNHIWLRIKPRMLEEKPKTRIKYPNQEEGKQAAAKQWKDLLRENRTQYLPSAPLHH